MTISIIGVLQSVLNKKKIQCACLGTVFNLPMSTVTIIEDALMIVMSGIMILNLIFKKPGIWKSRVCYKKFCSIYKKKHATATYGNSILPVKLDGVPSMFTPVLYKPIDSAPLYHLVVLLGEIDVSKPP